MNEDDDAGATADADATVDADATADADATVDADADADAPSASSDRRHVAYTALGALVLAVYASWMAADLAPRWLVVLAVALATGHVLYRRETGRGQAVYVAYALALALALTPAFVVLPNVLSAGTYGVGTFRLVFVIGNLVLLVPFLVLSAIAAYVGYRLDGGRGVRTRLSSARS